MRTKTNLMFFALLLTGLTACQRELVDEGGKPVVEEVNTQFVFNIATDQGQTKQDAAATQATTDQKFRGLEKALLLVYTQEKNGKILYEDATAAKKYELSTLVAPKGVTSTNTRRVLEMSLPLKTNTLVLYGKAPVGTLPTGLPEDVTDNDYFGHMDKYEVTDQVGSANFQAGVRLSDAQAVKYHLVEKVLAGVLSCGLNTSIVSTDVINATTVPEGGSNAYGYTVATPTLVSWRDYAYNGDGTEATKSPVETGHSLYPLEEKMGHVYKVMTDVKAAEIRAGSGEAIEATMQDMWTVINEVRCATPLSAAEAHAKLLAQKVHRKMINICTATVPTTGAPVTGVDFKYPKNFAAIVASDQAQWPIATTDGLYVTQAQMESLGEMDLSLFPLNFNLPRGGSHYKFNESKKMFYYVEQFDTSAMDGIADGTTYGVQSYYYPSELMYFGNSPIRTNLTEKKTDNYPGTAELAWEASTSWGGWADNSEVTSATRAVAMKYNVNYGMALLKTQVKFGAAVIYDNNHAIQKGYDNTLIDPSTPNAQDGDEPNMAITVEDGSFLLTGIIVGGQPHKVGWDYLPVTETVNNVTKYVNGFVYDHYIPTDSQSVPASGASEPVYTAVLDNYSTGAKQNSVYVALEFKNNTHKDFYGMANLIPEDGYFYLIGELNPYTKNSENEDVLKTISWPTLYQIPPYETTGEDAGKSKKIARVFIQDFMTSVTFTLGPNSLKYAYLTVPDLRSSSLTMGLSIDMNWSTGLNFDDVILGGN